MMKGIKEDHHFSALKDYLYQLYKDQALCDVSFITKNGKTVLAHKLIVAAFSGAVRTEVERWKDFTQVSLVVGCEDTVLEGILEFIYTGEVTVSHELLPHFHQESRGLQIPLLKNYLNSKYKAKKQTKFTAKSSSTKSGKTTANREWEMTVVSSLKKINEKPGRISLRDRNELKKSYVKYDNQDFIWDDGNDDDDGEDSRGVDIDDRHVKPTYNRNEFNDIKPDEKLLTWPVVKLERIDVSDFNIQALRNRRPKDNKYSRESLSELARQKRKRKCPSIPIAKHSVDKVKQSMKMFKRRKLTVSMAVNIVKQYKTKYSLVVGNSSGYSCKICKFSNKLAAAVKFHAKRHKQKRRCDTMSNAVHSKKEKFNRIKEKISRFECFICNRKYNLIRSLANHLIKRHQYSYEKTQKLTGYPKFFVFQTKTEAKCNDCSDWFDNLTELQDHCRLVHKNKKPKLDLCCIEEGCGQRFENLTSLKEHINILHKQKTKKKKSFIGSHIRPHQNGVQSQSDIEMSNTRNLHRKRQNYKYKVYLPSKFYKCSKCKKPTIFRNKKLFQKHQDLRHNKTFITKQLESQMIREKYLRLNYPRKKDFSKISPDSLSFISELNSAEQEIVNLSIVQSAIQSSTVTKSVSNAASSYEDTMQEILIKSPSTKPASSQQSNTQVETTLSALQLSKQTGDDVILDIANFDLEDIVINQQTSAKKDKKFICCKCGKSFHFYGQLGLHFKKNHGSYPLQQRKIYSKIQRHIKSCRYVCFRKFPVTDVSKEKLATQTSKSLTCEVCHKVYRFSRSLAKHLQRNHSYTFEEAQNVTGYPSFLVSASITFSRVKCIDCPQTFAETSSLRRHLKVAHKYTQGQVKEATSELTFSHDSSVVKPRKVEMHIKCKKCAKSFHTTNALDCHTVRTHGIPCKYCDKSLANKLALKRHVKKEHPEHLNEFTKMNVSMKIKDPQSGDVDQGSDDFKSRKEQKIYQCEKCEFLTKKLNELISHVIDVHPEIEYPCPVCGFTLRSKISLENHIRLKHSEGQMKNVCSFCQKGFPRKSILILHQFKQHGIDHPDIKQYKCDIEGCNKVFCSNTDLRKHVRQAHQVVEKKFPCQQCQFVTHSRHNLSDHVRNIHLKIKPHLCESCGKEYAKENQLKQHIKRHHWKNQGELRCELCTTFQCALKHQLQTHMWNTHRIKMADDNRRYYQCDRCAFQTPLSNKFKHHMDSHNNVRNYLCDQCDAKFVTRTTLNVHKKWKHSSGESTKICNQCGYETRGLGRLNEHIRVQHQLKGIRPFRCPYCDFTSATGGNCRKHVMGKHKGQPVRYECDKEYLEVAKMARKEGNTNPLDV